jgi:hypothetical protein
VPPTTDGAVAEVPLALVLAGLGGRSISSRRLRIACSMSLVDDALSAAMTPAEPTNSAQAAANNKALRGWRKEERGWEGWSREGELCVIS